MRLPNAERIKRFLIGRPFPTSMEANERLDKIARFMHNRTAERLRNRLTHHSGIVIIEVPYHIR
jgi:DNA replication protein DnaC